MKIKDLLRPQELRVIQLLAEGYDNQGIAKKLSITESTAKNHITRIYQRLDLSSAFDNYRNPRVLAAVRYIQENGDNHENDS